MHSFYRGSAISFFGKISAVKEQPISMRKEAASPFSYFGQNRSETTTDMYVLSRYKGKRFLAITYL